MSYILTDEAVESLETIRDYIALRDARAADRWIEAMTAAFERLGEFPLIGHSRTDLTDLPVRFWSVKHHMILHRGRDPVAITDIIDARRDLKTVLR